MSSAEQARWFSENVQPHEPALRAYLSKRFPALPDHDDLVQETYVRVLRVEDPARLAHPKAFLFTTARNAAIDLFRRRNVQPLENLDDVIDLPPLDEAPGVADSLERRQRGETLTEALRSLPERCREVFMLSRSGLSQREISERLDISEKTVESQISKALKILRQLLREYTELI